MCSRSISAIFILSISIFLVNGDILFFNRDGLRCEDAENDFNVLDRSGLKPDEATPGDEKVVATSCRIHRIEPNAFQGLEALKTLNLSDNLLSQIGADDLKTLVNVEVVDLSKNALRTLHPDAFVNNKKMAYLNLSDNVLFLNDFTKEMASPGVNFNLVFDNNRPDIFDTVIRSEDGMIDGTNTIFHRVVASHMYGDRQIKDLESQLKHLISANSFRLSLIGNGLQTLASDTFHKCRKLFYLKLSNNRLEALPADIFSRNTIMRIVHLQKNKIVSLSENIFKTPSKLTVIDLRYNLLRSLPVNLFRPLRDLQILRLANNELTSIHSNLLSANTKLVTLELGGNLIKELNPNFLSANTWISGLDLSRNHLANVPYEIVDKLDKLKTLRLDNNFFKDLSPRFYQKDGLEELTVFCNNMTTFPLTIKEIKPRKLYLHGNPWKCGCLTYIISLGVSYKVPNADRKVPLICILGRDQDHEVCDDDDVDPQVLKEWSYSTGKFKDTCNPILEKLLDVR